MGQKRNRDGAPRPHAKKKRPGVVRAQNSFGHLADHDVEHVSGGSDHSDTGGNDIILVESDDGVVVVSDSPEPAAKRPKKERKARAAAAAAAAVAGGDGNEMARNNDFIGFGSSSSDEEDAPAAPLNTYPWVKGQDHAQQKEIADWLTLEIKDFANYISPAREEIVTRNDVINSLKKNIAGFWPATQAHVFGSCATDLYLPGSDIDMVVISSTGDYEQRNRLYQLSSFLRTHKLAKNINVIASAKVPIIKFQDVKSNIQVDISFERTNGLDAARRIRRWLDTTPGLRELVLVVKQFLRSRKLNDVSAGGLGGYATIILVYHFLRLHPRIAAGNLSPLENLGTLLIEFFELYGRNYSYDNLIVALDPRDDSPRYLLKQRYPALCGRGQFTLSIQDPSDPNNNISRSTYNLRDLKKAFGGAFQLLTSKCYELNAASYKNRIGQSILGDIITYTGKDRDFNDERDQVVNNALVAHLGDSESDGADGNDKYYFSDMSESEEYEPAEPAKEKAEKSDKSEKKKKQKLPQAPASAPARPQAKQDSKELPKPAEQPQSPKVKAEHFMSIEESSGDEGYESAKAAALDKDSRRDYWKSKGLETGN